MANPIPSSGDWQYHVYTTMNTAFQVTKRTRDRKTGQIYLWNGSVRIPLEECAALKPELSQAGLEDVIQCLQAADGETTALIKQAMSRVFAYPAWKQQVWQALPNELKQKLLETQNV